MTTLAEPAQYSPAEIAQHSDESGKLYELAGGNLVEKRAMSTRANWVAAHIGLLLKSTYPSSRAYVFSEQPTYCFDNPRHMRRPHVSLVWAERLPGGPTDDELHIAPDLVVEVVSPTDTFDDQMGRLAEYLEAGVPMIWIVQPARQWLHVYRGDGSVTLLRAGGTLKDEPLLPGFELKMSDLFPPTAAPAVPAGQ